MRINMRGRLVRSKWEVEELIKIISKKYGVTEFMARSYFIVLGMWLFLKTSINNKHKITWDEVRRYLDEIRKELGGTES